MVLRFNMMMLLAFGLFSCSAGGGGARVIGTELVQEDPVELQVFEEAGKSYFYSYDEHGRRINFIDPTASALTFSPELAGSKHAFLASKPGGFAFDVSENIVNLRSNNLQSSKQVLKLAGKIISSTTDFSQGYVVFVDEFFSIGILQIDAAGETVASWTGGPVIDGISSVSAGEMLDGGKLLLLVNGGKSLLVDLAASVSAKAWQFTQTEFGFKNASWVGRVVGRGDRALVQDSNSMNLLDLTNGVILETIKPSTTLKPSKNGEDHAFYWDVASSDIVIVHADSADSIRESRLKLVDQDPVLSSLSDEYLVMVTRSGSIVKYRLSDGLVQGKYEMSGLARVGLSEDYAALMYDSALGYVEIIDLNSGNRSKFQAFNLDALQR